MRCALILAFIVVFYSKSLSQDSFLVEVGGFTKNIGNRYKIDSLSTIITENPSDYKNFYHRALLFYQARRASDALNDVTLFLTKANEDYNGHLLLGKIHVIRVNPIQAIEEFERAIGINPKNPSAYLEKAAVLCSRSDLESALSFINDAAKLFPKEKELSFYRGQVFLKLGQFKKSISELMLFVNSTGEKDSLELAIAFHDAADANLSIKNYQKALVLVNNSITTMRKFRPSLGLRGEIKYKLKDLDGALSDINQMIKNGFESSRYWRVLGKIYEERNDRKMACLYYSKYCDFVSRSNSYNPELRTCARLLKLNCN
jgi:tetratricopeptide (TPR) repeat protein